MSRARERFCTSVGPHVNGQRRRVPEHFFTYVTLIWLFTCMCSHVTGQPRRVPELLLAYFTLVRLFTCMYPHVQGDIT